jgi:hypothetical protein
MTAHSTEISRMHSFVRAMFTLLVPATLSAQAIGPAEYAARRDSLAARLGDGILVGFGAPSPTGVDRQAQLPAFRWLTGFLEPDAALVLVLRGGRATGTLFTQARDPRRALYDGFPPDSAAVARFARGHRPDPLHAARLRWQRLRRERLAHARGGVHARVRGGPPAARGA